MDKTTEWQKDKYGKRFRMVGNIKEYETMVRLSGKEVPESQVSEYNARNKAQTEAILKDENAKSAVPVKSCPFRTGLQQQCRDNCALHTINGCSLALIISRTPSADTSGKICPFGPYGCNKNCSLYNNGCIFAAI